MKQDIRSKFEEFKKYTLESINSLKDDDFESLHNLISKRQYILDEIYALNPSQEEYKIIVKELDIKAIDNKLSEIIKEKRKELKYNIDIIEKNKNASNSYSQNALRKAIIFSKKI